MRKKELVSTLFKISFSILLAIIIIPLLGAGWYCTNITGSPPDTSVQTEAGANPFSPEIIRARESLIKYPRGEDQTYLTLPEWYIVYSSDEYGTFLADNRPSQFPYFQSIAQYWGTYYDVCAVTKSDYPFNSSYHSMLAIIGTSFTIEYVVKGVYENTVGRLTEWLSGGEPTEEDRYAQNVAQVYGQWLHTIPWFEFPYGETLQGLWTETSWWGPHPIRKWERKMALSLEYGFKGIYGWLIKKGTQTTYEGPVDVEIQALVTGLSEEMVAQEEEVQLTKSINPTTAFITIPRYEAFTKLVPRLTDQGLQFMEIAGNDEIMLTALVPSTWEYRLPVGELLLSMPILTEPDRKRVAVKARVESLHLVLEALAKEDLTLEHIYDY